MTPPTAALARASLAGTLQLITLCLSGAFLSHLHILTSVTCASWSAAIFRLFLPSLLFLSLLRALVTAFSTSIVAVPAHIWLPSVWALVVLISSAILAAIASRLCLKASQPRVVRRVAFVAVLLGNANNLPLLLLRALCDNHAALTTDPHCADRAAGYIALFVAVWNSVTWTVVLAYVTSPPSHPSAHPEERLSLVDDSSSARPSREALSHSASQSSTSTTTMTPSLSPTSYLTRVLSPPMVSMICAVVIAMIPGGPDVFLTPTGLLAPVRQAVALLADMTVPASSLVVGARLHVHAVRARQALSRNGGGGKGVAEGEGETVQLRGREDGGEGGDGDEQEEGIMSAEGEQNQHGGLCVSEVIALVAARYVALPLVGRVLVLAAAKVVRVDDGLLRVYMMIPFFMPTASNSVVMVHLAAQNDAVAAAEMERTLLTLMFWQYAVAPVFLTANVALSLVTALDGRSTA